MPKKIVERKPKTKPKKEIEEKEHIIININTII